MFAKFDKILSMILQDIKKTKRYGHTVGRSFGRSDNVKTVYPSTNIVCGGIIIGYSTVFCKIQYFTEHCRTIFLSYILINASMSEMGLTARTIAKAYQSLRLGHKPLIYFSMRRLNTYKSDQIYIMIFSCRPAWH